MTSQAARARGLATVFVRGGAAVCAAALLACTSGEPPPSAAPSSSPPFAVPTPPLSVVETGDLAGVAPVPWQFATLVDERTLDVRYLGARDRCQVLANVRVRETATEVTVTVYLGTPPDRTAGICTTVGVPARTRVPLSAPLGGRRVLDGGRQPPEERAVRP